MRRDARLNRERLIEAAGKILSTQPDQASIPLIAETAGVSVATAYRFFPSLDELLGAFVLKVIIVLRDFSHDCPKTGKPLFETVVAEWLRLLGVYGAGMVQLRSRRGYLERLHQGDQVIGTVRDAWERPIRSVLRAEHIDDDQFEWALFIRNVLFDPREVIDLLGLGLTSTDINRRLTSTYYGALRGWAEA